MKTNQILLFLGGAVVGYFLVAEGKKWKANKENQTISQLATTPTAESCEQKWNTHAMTLKMSSAEALNSAKVEFISKCMKGQA